METVAVKDIKRVKEILHFAIPVPSFSVPTQNVLTLYSQHLPFSLPLKGSTELNATTGLNATVSLASPPFGAGTTKTR
jgi:hypothetical protein